MKSKPKQMWAVFHSSGTPLAVGLQRKIAILHYDRMMFGESFQQHRKKKYVYVAKCIVQEIRK
jgi:hypothetical protein